MGPRHQVKVDVAAVWAAPDAPRPVDAAALTDEPEVARWTDGLGADDRLGLHGRLETQALRGEPVEIIDESSDGWAHVAVSWQPSPKGQRGYPGWVRRAHLTETADLGAGVVQPPARVPADAGAITRYARRYLGLRYLWGGLSPYGLDCSGLVHLSFREAGLVVPRDAYAQHLASSAVPLGAEEPGDLYFFASDDGRVTHVGFVTGPGRMLHAPEGAHVEDVALADDRRATLIAAGRLTK